MSLHSAGIGAEPIPFSPDASSSALSHNGPLPGNCPWPACAASGTYSRQTLRVARQYARGGFVLPGRHAVIHHVGRYTSRYKKTVHNRLDRVLLWLGVL